MREKRRNVSTCLNGHDSQDYTRLKQGARHSTGAPGGWQRPGYLDISSWLPRCTKGPERAAGTWNSGQIHDTGAASNSLFRCVSAAPPKIPFNLILNTVSNTLKSTLVRSNSYAAKRTHLKVQTLVNSGKKDFIFLGRKAWINRQSNEEFWILLSFFFYIKQSYLSHSRLVAVSVLRPGSGYSCPSPRSLTSPFFLFERRRF